jgi:hypothetical protein
VKMQQRMQHTSEYGIPTRQSADLAPGEVKVTGYQHGMPVVRHGGGVSDADLKIHQDLARQTGVEWNPLQRATNALTGKKPEHQFGSKGYQFNHEAGKHQRMADAAFSQAKEMRQKGDMAGASQLERHGRSYLEASQRYASLAQNPDIKNQKGDGEIAANKKLTPEEQAQLQEPKIPKGDRPAVPTFKENPRGIAIPGKAEAKAKAVAVRKASRQPGYKPTEEDAFHIVADAINRGKLQDRKNVLTAASGQTHLIQTKS